MTLRFTRLFLLLSLALTTCVSAPKRPTHSGFMYRITHPNGRSALLVGTIHVGKDDGSALPAQFPSQAALAKTKRLMVEIDFDDIWPGYSSQTQVEKGRLHLQSLADLLITRNQSVAEGAESVWRLPANRTLSDYADANYLKKWKEQFNDPKCANFKNYLNTLTASARWDQLSPESILLYSVLCDSTDTNAMMKKGNFSTEWGTEQLLQQWAHSHAAGVRSLETMDVQYNALLPKNGKNLTDQFLILANMDDKKSSHLTDDLDEVETMYAKWIAGDVGFYESLVGELKQMSSHSAYDKEQEQRLLSDRNRKMAEKLMTCFENDDNPCLIAVGSLHLFGENGLLNLLSKNHHITNTRL